MVDLDIFDEHYSSSQLIDKTTTEQKWLRVNEFHQPEGADLDASRAREKPKVAHLPIDEYPDVVISKRQPSASVILLYYNY